MTDPRPRRFARSSSVDTDGLRTAYSPDPDGAADPGEIVWTWVPYEEDQRLGKDRPMLIVARRGAVLYGLMMSSNPRRAGDDGWLELGAGTWDAERRASFVRLDRVLELHENDIRRECVVLRRDQFDRVAHALRTGHGWA
ncbi:MAG TPA: type II toxin-antitoxin system PemK/MazF family toxin [Pseudonocardiaceae bacterium]|nr:type II toxin-antitoxin system PemK/MazF family toxin [Pseudonocardiaceae bacterium]